MFVCGWLFSLAKAYGEQLDGTGSSIGNEGERSQTVTVGIQRENSSPRIISPEGCCGSEAYQLLSDRMYSQIKSLIIL